jgi:hypothetical protein
MATIGTQVHRSWVGTNIGSSLLDRAWYGTGGDSWGPWRVGRAAGILFVFPRTNSVVKTVQTCNKLCEGLIRWIVLVNKCILDFAVQTSLQGMALGLIIVLEDGDQTLKLRIVLTEFAVVLV